MPDLKFTTIAKGETPKNKKKIVIVAIFALLLLLGGLGTGLYLVRQNQNIKTPAAGANCPNGCNSCGGATPVGPDIWCGCTNNQGQGYTNVGCKPAQVSPSQPGGSSCSPAKFDTNTCQFCDCSNGGWSGNECLANCRIGSCSEPVPACGQKDFPSPNTCDPNGGCPGTQCGAVNYSINKSGCVSPTNPPAQISTPTPTKTPTATPIPISTPTPTKTPTPTPTKTPTPTPTKTPTPTPTKTPTPTPTRTPTPTQPPTGGFNPTPTPTKTPTPTPTKTPTPTPTRTPTPTPTSVPTNTPTVQSTSTPTPTNPPTASNPNACNGTCGSDANCNPGLTCYLGFCRNPNNPTNTSCSDKPGAVITPTPIASLPQTGTEEITWLVAFFALSLIGSGLLLTKK